VNRSRFALVGALAVDNLGSGLFLPLALVYATRAVGLPVHTAGTVVAAATLIGLAVPVLAGRLVHRLGPRPVVVLAQLVQCAGALGYLLAGGPAEVFVGAALMAAGVQLFYCSVFVLVADASTSVAKERPFALIGMVRAGAFGLGNLVAAVALSTLGDAALRLLVAVDAATFLVAAAVLAAFVRTPRVDHASTSWAGPVAVLRDRRYRTLMTSTMLVALALDFSMVGVPVFLLDLRHGPEWLPGALLAGGTLLASVLGVRVVDAVAGRRRSRTLQAGSWLYVGWAAATAATIWLPDGWLVPMTVLGMLLAVAGNKLFYPVSGALSEALAPRESRGGYMATYQLSFTLAQTLAPAVVALFVFGAWLPWVVVAVALLASVAAQRGLGDLVPAHVDRPQRVGTVTA
jgi:MFS family permease